MNKTPAGALPNPVPQLDDNLIDLKSVRAGTGLSGSTIYKLMENQAFPQAIRLGKKCTRWRASEVSAWIKSLGAA